MMSNKFPNPRIKRCGQNILRLQLIVVDKGSYCIGGGNFHFVINIPGSDIKSAPEYPRKGKYVVNLIWKIRSPRDVYKRQASPLASSIFPLTSYATVKPSSEVTISLTSALTSVSYTHLAAWGCYWPPAIHAIEQYNSFKALSNLMLFSLVWMPMRIKRPERPV